MLWNTSLCFVIASATILPMHGLLIWDVRSIKSLESVPFAYMDH